MLAIELPDELMADGWYTGQRPIYFLRIERCRLRGILSNAFTGNAFSQLELLWFFDTITQFCIFDGAFEYLRTLRSLRFSKSIVTDFRAGLFRTLAPIMPVLVIEYGWPGNVGLGEMFADILYARLITLFINHVIWPQTKFHHLAASNFTNIRNVRYMALVDCGIEVIEDNTFDELADRIQDLNLEQNHIKSINLNMFRKIYESKSLAYMYLDGNALECTCALIEVELLRFAFIFGPPSNIECIQKHNFSRDMCGLIQKFKISRIKSNVPDDQTAVMLVIDIQMKQHNQSISIRTNFSSTFHVLLIDMDDTISRRCTRKRPKLHFVCVNMNRSIERFELDEIAEMPTAKFISITVIPILYRFGARPMHSITIRRRWATSKRYWLWTVLIGTVLGVCGIICGSLIGICTPSLRRSHAK